MGGTQKIDLYENFKSINSIDAEKYKRYDVKRGLRNADGTGVLAGLTGISNVHGYVMSDGEKRACAGTTCTTFWASTRKIAGSTTKKYPICC